MPRGKQNGTSSGSAKRTSSKLGNFVRAKRASRDFPTDVESTIIESANADDAIDDIVTNDTFDADNGIVVETGSTARGSGNDGNGRGSGDGDGDGNGSRRSADNNSAGSKRRGRRSAEDRAADLVRENPRITIEEARKIIETQKKPRKVKSFAADLEAGVTGSAILLGGIFEGGSQLLAMALSNKQFDRSYMKLEKDEAHSLGDALLKVLEAQSKYNRKRFDEFMKKIYPYWNLAKVLTEIGYPRYEIYRMELELKIELAKQAKSGNASENSTSTVNQGFQTTSPSFSASASVVEGSD